MSFHTYILRCADGSYYTGHTDDLEQRLAQHHAAAIPACYTATRLPLECVFVQSFASREEALAAERQIKGWSRKKKEAMLRGDWAEVSRLARGRTEIAVRPEPVEGWDGETRGSTGSPRTVVGKMRGSTSSPRTVVGEVSGSIGSPRTVEEPPRTVVVRDSRCAAETPNPVRPELVEGRGPAAVHVHPSTGSGRTEGGATQGPFDRVQDERVEREECASQ
jgi:putative endonuclease